MGLYSTHLRPRLLDAACEQGKSRPAGSMYEGRPTA
jgi:hypothetical protein